MAISEVAAAMRVDLTPAQLKTIWQLHLAREHRIGIIIVGLSGSGEGWEGGGGGRGGEERGTGESGNCSGEGKGRESGASPFSTVFSKSLPLPPPPPPPVQAIPHCGRCLRRRMSVWVAYLCCTS